MRERIGFGFELLVIVVMGALAGCSGGSESAEANRQTDPHAPQGRASNESCPVVMIETSMGSIKAELWPDKAPKTVANFLRYADDGFYDGLVFHRVMDGFMIQGGGLTPDLRRKSTRQPIPNEASRELRNDRGTLAMARTGEIHSATSQFYINLVDNEMLNHRGARPDQFGYCVFGKIVEGMEVVDRIAKVRTVRVGPQANVPAEPVIIRTIRRAK